MTIVNLVYMIPQTNKSPCNPQYLKLFLLIFVSITITDVKINYLQQKNFLDGHLIIKEKDRK
jgi:hypothetical protein